MSSCAPVRRLYNRTLHNSMDVEWFSDVEAVGSRIPSPTQFTAMDIWFCRLVPMLGWSSSAGRKSYLITFLICL